MSRRDSDTTAANPWACKICGTDLSWPCEACGRQDCVLKDPETLPCSPDWWSAESHG